MQSNTELNVITRRKLISSLLAGLGVVIVTVIPMLNQRQTGPKPEVTLGIKVMATPKQENG